MTAFYEGLTRRCALKPSRPWLAAWGWSRIHSLRGCCTSCKQCGWRWVKNYVTGRNGLSGSRLHQTDTPNIVAADSSVTRPSAAAARLWSLGTLRREGKGASHWVWRGQDTSTSNGNLQSDSRKLLLSKLAQSKLRPGLSLLFWHKTSVPLFSNNQTLVWLATFFSFITHYINSKGHERGRKLQIVVV